MAIIRTGSYITWIQGCSETEMQKSSQLACYPCRSFLLVASMECWNRALGEIWLSPCSSLGKDFGELVRTLPNEDEVPLQIHGKNNAVLSILCQLLSYIPQHL